MHQYVQARSNLQFSVTDTLVGKLIALTIETGIATACVALSDLILFLIFPETNMHFLAFVSPSIIEKPTDAHPIDVL